jgi:hypothetical protein
MLVRPFGTTQLYNCLWVYNHKRQCRLELGAQMFEFRMRPNFPIEATPEFLLTELLYNLDSLAEDRDTVLTRVLKRLQVMGTRFYAPRLEEDR